MADSNPAAQTDADAKATPERRRSAIVDAVLKDGTLRIEGLADSLGVSAATIYRDVQILKDSGLLTLSKGELRPRASSTAELPPRMRRIRSRIEKGALAQAAARLVSAGNAVIIDDSSTALPMVPELAKVNPLTVITNSMPVARSLAASKNTELVLIGGRYYPWAEAFYGSLGTGFVKNLRADLCFMSDAAVWYDGVYNPTDYVTDMKRTMLEAVLPPSPHDRQLQIRAPGLAENDLADDLRDDPRRRRSHRAATRHARGQRSGGHGRAGARTVRRGPGSWPMQALAHRLIHVPNRGGATWTSR